MRKIRIEICVQIHPCTLETLRADKSSPLDLQRLRNEYTRRKRSRKETGGRATHTSETYKAPDDMRILQWTRKKMTSTDRNGRNDKAL